MSSSRTMKKRKAAQDNPDGEGQAGQPAPALRVDANKPTPADDDDDDDGLHLPAPVWGRVLEYMQYDEVRSALLICKMMANEAVKYVQTLNIMKVLFTVDGRDLRVNHLDKMANSTLDIG